MQVSVGKGDIFRYVAFNCIIVVVGGGQLVAKRDLLCHLQRTIISRATHVNDSTHWLFEGVAESEEVLPLFVFVWHLFVVSVDGLDNTSGKIVE